MGRYAQQRRRGTGPEAGVELRVLTVTITGDRIAQWDFDHEVTVINPATLAGLRTNGANDPITGSIVTPTTLSVEYDPLSPILQEDDPWDVWQSPPGMLPLVEVPQSGLMVV